MKLLSLFCLLIQPALVTLPGGVDSLSAQDGERWSLGKENNIQWGVVRDKRLSHEDHLEMSGLKISSIVTYRVDTAKRIHIQNLVIWPSFIIKFDYRSYLMRSFETDGTPSFFINGQPHAIPSVKKITLTACLAAAGEFGNEVNTLKIVSRQAAGKAIPSEKGAKILF
jgi:hypothetical protein